MRETATAKGSPAGAAALSSTEATVRCCGVQAQRLTSAILSKSLLLSDRLYFLGDWVDEYCDLTLDSLVNDMKDISGEEIAHELKIEYNQNELKDKIAKTVAPDEDPKIPEDKVNDTPENPPYRELNIGEKARVFFAKVRTILSRKK